MLSGVVVAQGLDLGDDCAHSSGVSLPACSEHGWFSGSTGCRCHESVLFDQSLGKWAGRVRRYRRVSEACHNKGRRAVELALGFGDTIAGSMRDASDSLLRECYTTMSPADRAAMHKLETDIKASLSHRISMKFSFWGHLPHCLIGVYGAEVGLCELSRSKSIAQHCIREFDAACASVGVRKIHRVAILFLGPGSVHRRALAAFAACPSAELGEYPELLLELRAYALSPCVSRRVEASHSAIQGFRKKASYHSIPWLGARLRRCETKALLQDYRFMEWLCATWSRRDIIRQSLKCIFSWRKLSKMSAADVVHWWYQCHKDAHFRDQSSASQALAQWPPQARAAAKPDAAVVSDGEKLLLNFFRSARFSREDVVLSAPRSLLPKFSPDQQGRATVHRSRGHRLRGQCVGFGATSRRAFSASGRPSAAPELGGWALGMLIVGFGMCILLRSYRVSSADLWANLPNPAVLLGLACRGQACALHRDLAQVGRPMFNSVACRAGCAFTLESLVGYKACATRRRLVLCDCELGRLVFGGVRSVGDHTTS